MISATPYAYIAGASVQAQLQELVAHLGSGAGGSAGGSRIGAAPAAGRPP